MTFSFKKLAQNTTHYYVSIAKKAYFVMETTLVEIIPLLFKQWFNWSNMGQDLENVLKIEVFGKELW